MALTTWTIDPAHTDVLFSAKHLMVTTVRGTFTEVAGSITVDETDPTTARGTFAVKTASVSTGVEQRDGHLRSADFFDAENRPEITFTATGVASKGGDDYAITGDLTILDVTKSVTFDVEFLGFYSGMNGARRLGLHASGRILREDFGLSWNVPLENGGWLVGKDIKLEFDLAFEQAAAVATETAEAASAA